MLMKSAIFMNGRKFDETEFRSEEEFEKTVREHFRTLFGAGARYQLFHQSNPVSLYFKASCIASKLRSYLK